jgi:hypothetical protein
MGLRLVDEQQRYSEGLAGSGARVRIEIDGFSVVRRRRAPGAPRVIELDYRPGRTNHTEITVQRES